VQSFGFFATIVGLGGDGLVPISTLGREYFRYEEGAQALVGEQSGTRYAVGDTVELKLAEANPLTGALKFEPLDAGGSAIESRGRRPEAKKGRPKYPQGQRGRPANIRHQGRKRK
jgi:ribonuclease R